MAKNYANIENQISVLSNLHTNRSYIFYGEFAKVMGLEQNSNEETVYSIWEKAILNRIHPDDLKEKYLHELYFFDFIKQQPKNKRGNFHLINKIRMKDSFGNYRDVIHRTLYISLPKFKNVWLALCLYGPMWMNLPSSIILNSVTGETTELGKINTSRILTDREREILRCINKGMTSKEIASQLSISKNTVSRHRQEILNKLQVRNSIEACRIAAELKLI